MDSLLLVCGLLIGLRCVDANSNPQPSVDLKTRAIIWILSAGMVTVIALQVIYQIVLMVKKILKEIGVWRRKPPRSKRQHPHGDQPKPDITDQVEADQPT